MKRRSLRWLLTIALASGSYQSFSISRLQAANFQSFPLASICQFNDHVADDIGSSLLNRSELSQADALQSCTHDSSEQVSWIAKEFEKWAAECNLIYQQDDSGLDANATDVVASINPNDQYTSSAIVIATNSPIDGEAPAPTIVESGLATYSTDQTTTLPISRFEEYVPYDLSLVDQDHRSCLTSKPIGSFSAFRPRYIVAPFNDESMALPASSLIDDRSTTEARPEIATFDGCVTGYAEEALPAISDSSPVVAQEFISHDLEDPCYGDRSDTDSIAMAATTLTGDDAEAVPMQADIDRDAWHARVEPVSELNVQLDQFWASVYERAALWYDSARIGATRGVAEGWIAEGWRSVSEVPARFGRFTWSTLRVKQTARAEYYTATLNPEVQNGNLPYPTADSTASAPYDADNQLEACFPTQAGSGVTGFDSSGQDAIDSSFQEQIVNARQIAERLAAEALAAEALASQLDAQIDERSANAIDAPESFTAESSIDEVNLDDTLCNPNAQTNTVDGYADIAVEPFASSNDSGSFDEIVDEVATDSTTNSNVGQSDVIDYDFEHNHYAPVAPIAASTDDAQDLIDDYAAEQDQSDEYVEAESDSSPVKTPGTGFIPFPTVNEPSACTPSDTYGEYPGLNDDAASEVVSESLQSNNVSEVSDAEVATNESFSEYLVSEESSVESPLEEQAAADVEEVVVAREDSTVFDGAALSREIGVSVIGTISESLHDAGGWMQAQAAWLEKVNCEMIASQLSNVR